MQPITRIIDYCEKLSTTTVPGPEEGVEELSGGNVVALVAHLVELPVLRVANSKICVKNARNEIRVWPKTGSGALNLKRRMIFKSLLNEYFRYFLEPSFLFSYL